jgi:curved DNA-binding protein CbpA
MTKLDESKDYYAILGAEADATRVEIDRLYKRKAILYHPDRGGSEEDMKTLNEAYHVLKEQTSRQAYDIDRQVTNISDDVQEVIEPQQHSSPGAKVDAITHQILTSGIFLVLGLVLLLIVRFQYVIFLWPLALLAVFMIFVGLVQAHSAIGAVRRQIKNDNSSFRLILVQEAVFWSFVIGGGYGVYLLLTSSG